MLHEGNWFGLKTMYFKDKPVCILIVILIPVIFAGPGDIARAKCEEYGKAVFSTEDSPVLLMAGKKNTVSQCGIVEVPLIVGGIKAKPKEFPHMALIGFGASPSSALAWVCGGSLISENYVLTAAHCTESKEKGPAQKVRLGELDMASTNDETETQEINIVQKINHPEYAPPKKYHDIALLKLEAPVRFTGYVRPACLNVEENIRSPVGIASGFGKLSFDASDGSKDLMKVTLKNIDSTQCAASYKKEIENGDLDGGIHASMLCAGELDGGKDTCQGDSGGPLQIVLTQPECMYSLTGVTSFGKFCGFKNSPAIYSRVSYYISWIESIVWS